MKVLVTCGPTWVPIDRVRVISNLSSGEMGHTLAQAFQQAGASVTLLEGPVTRSLKTNRIRIVKFAFYEELARLLKKELRKPYAYVVHAAAVADYRLPKPYQGKLPSGQKAMNLKLVPTEKLITKIKKLCPTCCLIGFKLEPAGQPRELKTKARRLAKATGSDLVVVNILKPSYHAWLADREGKVLARADSRLGITQKLVHTLKEQQ